MDRFNLGPHTRTISTTSPEAQRWFNLGLNWCYGFNREEAIKCFRKALEFDPECVMAHWGMAYAAGPFYNLAWREYGEQEANAATKLGCDHISRARASAGRATELENKLVEAIARRSRSPMPWRWKSTTAGTMTTLRRCGASISTTATIRTWCPSTSRR